MHRADLERYQAEYDVISVRLQAGEPVIHVWSHAGPGGGFEGVEPALEDVYFHQVGEAADRGAGDATATGTERPFVGGP